VSRVDPTHTGGRGREGGREGGRGGGRGGERTSQGRSGTRVSCVSGVCREEDSQVSVQYFFAGSRLRLELPADMSARGERGGEGG
jgi:hypothetical protein